MYLESTLLQRAGDDLLLGVFLQGEGVAAQLVRAPTVVHLFNHPGQADPNRENEIFNKISKLSFLYVMSLIINITFFLNRVSLRILYRRNAAICYRVKPVFRDKSLYYKRDKSWNKKIPNTSRITFLQNYMRNNMNVSS